MAELHDAINDVIGTPTDTAGFRYYTNWSTTATAGVGASYALTINRKIEGPPRPFTDSPTEDFPGIYIERIGAFPSARLVEKHYDVEFNVRIYYVAKATANSRPAEIAREMICQITENILASDKLGLTFIDSVEWKGFDENNEIVKIFPLTLPDYFAACSDFSVKAQVAF